jgi:malate dehydrogenase (oxaloacetate-decarboxylating)
MQNSGTNKYFAMIRNKKEVKKLLDNADPQEAKRVTDNMMIRAANALGNFQDGRGSNNEDAAESALLPPIENMRDVAIHIAIGVALQAQKDGVAPEMSKQQISDHLQKIFCIPEYRNYKL